MLGGRGGGAGGAEQRKATASALTAEEKIAADKNPQCHLFTPAESRVSSVPPWPPDTTRPSAPGRQWVARPARGSATIRSLPRATTSRTGRAGVPTALPDVGTKGFVESRWARGMPAPCRFSKRSFVSLCDGVRRQRCDVRLRC